MISLLIFLLVLGVLILIHEFGHFLAAKKVGVRVEKFSLGFGPKVFCRTKGQTSYCLNAIPLGGYVKLAGDNLEEYKGRPDEYFSKSLRQRAAIIFFGPFLNYVLGFLFFWVILFAGYPTLTNKVGGVVDGFGAKLAGIQAGDRITAIDGKNVEYWEDIQKNIQSKKTSTVKLSILRQDKPLNIDVKIREKSVDDQLGQKRSVGLIGITPFDEIVTIRHGFFESFLLAGQKTWDLTVLTYKALWRMITGKLSMRETMTGPLGIFFITSKAASLGIIMLLHLVAVLNISLAIFNLLPIPVLDGGHILFLGIEKIRGKALSLKAERVVTNIGLTAIFSLAIIATYNDLMRVFGDKITKFLQR